MPQKPELARPILPVVPATLTEAGRAAESGVGSFLRESCELMADQPERLEGNFSLPWKARLRISSAYMPPSPELLMSYLGVVSARGLVAEAQGLAYLVHDAVEHLAGGIAAFSLHLEVDSKTRGNAEGQGGHSR